jgi:multidrug efflux pump subunit AcrA (membrane-fusion protein)
MSDSTGGSWLVYILGALCVAAIVAAFLVVGPASQSATALSRTVTVSEGVVQSTVSGSGNLQAASQLNLGFKTSGVVTHIYVTQGEHVSAGQLIATLNPQSAEVTLEQAKATLQAAEANLAQEEESNGESSAGAGTETAKASTAAFGPTGATGTTGAAGSTGLTGAQTMSTTTVTITASATSTASTSTTTPVTARSAPASKAPKTTTTSTQVTTSEKAKQSEATRDANLASAKAAVKSDKLAVQSAEETVTDTRLYAPSSGTIVSLSGEVGETVSGSGTSKASSSSSSAASTSTGAGATATSSRSATSSSSTGGSSSGSSTGSSSAFAVLSDLSSMELVVPLSESEIGSVSVGQPATVTVEALEGRKVAAEVVSVATLSTTNSGVVSYDVTFRLNQLTGGLKPGMSASAEVVIKQAEGVNVPSTAITGDTVTVIEGSKRVRRTVLTGLAGNSSTIILMGLKAGEKVALPITSTSSSASSLTSRLAGRTSGLGGGLGGGGFTGGGFGGGGFGGGGARGGG